MKWFAENKPELLIEHPDIPASELTKIAMRKYKMFTADMKSDKTVNNKRKTMDDEDRIEGSTVKTKLAKFGFTKAS